MNKEFLAKKKDIDELKNGKVDKEEGKGLSQNDFTNIHKEAVEAIPEELQQKADLFHTHSKSDINDLDGALDEKLNIASRNYVPVRYVSESMDFDTDFQLTSTDPNKVIFTNTKSVLNSNSPMGIPMPYMLTVEKLYVNGASNYFRQTFIGLMNAGSESAYIVEYQRLYIYTANPFWTEWKECDAAPSWSDIIDKPETFPPEAHRHGISDIDNLDSALNEKLSVASRSYVPIRSVTESANFNTDFQLTDKDPNKVIFINTRATGNTNIPTGIPMPYMLTVDRLYSNGNYYVLRQSFTGLSNYAAENAKVIEYERLYVCVTTNPFWTDWKKCDTAVLDTKFDTAGSGLTADGTTIKHTDIYSSTGFGNYHQQKYITWGDTISVPWGSVNSSGHLTTSGTVDVVLPEPLWSDITDKPGTFPPSDHSHSIGDINNLDSTLNGKLSVSSRNYVPVRYISESMDFDTDFQLTSTDPNKVIFTNTKSVLNSHDPTGIPMPYMLTVERLYVNGVSNYFRQTFTGLMNAGSESAYIVEYQRLYIYTANPFWTDWKAVASGGEDDHKVIQEYVGGADYEYPMLCSTDTEHTQSATTDKVLKLLGMTINPKTGTITAPKFKGILEGRASSADSVEWGNVSNKPESYPPETHSHNYAASTYAGGAALSANKLNTDAGSATVPVYFNNGVPTVCQYTLGSICTKSTSDYLPITGGTLTGSVTAPSFVGNATSASKLATARTINGVSFDGSANIAIPRSTKHIHVAAGTEGSVGYVKIATIKVTGEFANHPVEFVISQRSRGPYHLYVQFNSVSSTDPTLYQFKHFDPANKSVKAYIVKSATSTWDIYIEKVEAYDHIYILDVLKADGNEGAQYSITYTNVHTSSVPTTNQTKSTAVSFIGNASSATKLTTSAGSATVPVYFSDGVPTECTYELNKTVPADAVFTDGRIDQKNSSGNFSLPLLLGFNTDTDVNGFAWKNSKFTANPSTGEMTATTFNGSIAWGNVTGKPPVFPPKPHSHSMSDISSLNTTINSLSSTLNSINTALTLHKVLKPFTKSSGQPDLIVRDASYVQYNDYLWKFNLFFTNAKNISANTETVIATTSYPPKYDVVKTGVTIWKNDNSAVHTNNATVKIKSNGDITITTPTTISGTGVNYARMNGEVFTAVNF